MHRVRVHVALLFGLACFASSAPARADSPSPAPAVTEGAPAPRLDRAPVMLDGHLLFYLAGISAYPAAERAAAVSARISALATDSAYAPGSLSVSDEGDRTEIARGRQAIVDFFDGDARLEQVERAALSTAVRLRIDQAVQTYRKERTSEYLRHAALNAALATVALILWLLTTRLLLRRLQRGIERRYRSKVEQLGAQSLAILRAEQLWQALASAARTLWTLLAVGGACIYADVALGFFPWTRAAADWASGLLLSPLRAIGVGILDSVPNLVFLAVLFAVFRYLLKTAQVLFAGLASGAVSLPGFDPDWALPTFALIRLATLAFAVVVAFPYIPGSHSEAFKGVSLFVGLLVSLGSSSLISNTLAGYMLIYRRLFKVGDRVQIGNVVGEVVATRLQVTQLRTMKNEEVIVPNSSILNSEVKNFSSFARAGGIILHTTVGIGYETPWRQVEAMLLLAASRTEGLAREPKPFVLQESLADFAVNYELNAFCADARAMQAVHTEMHRQILDAFNEFGVAIMTPAYRADPAQPKLVARKDWFTAPAKPPSGDESGQAPT